MQQEGPCHLWIDAIWQRHAMETSAVRTPSAASDSNREAPPAAACDHGSQDLRDTKKTAAALMFSGAFLTLVGITCTAMARKNYFSPSNSFLWGWMLGPIFILCGGIFILLRVMECAMRRCWPYGRPEAEMFVVPVREQPSGRPPFMLHAANRPVVLQGGAAMLCVPPAYSFISQDVEQAGSSLTDVAVALPSYDALFSVDSAAGEGHSSGGMETDRRSSSMQKTTEEERRRLGRCSSTSSQPPAYEDIYPSSHKPSPS